MVQIGQSTNQIAVINQTRQIQLSSSAVRAGSPTNQIIPPSTSVDTTAHSSMRSADRHVIDPAVAGTVIAQLTQRAPVRAPVDLPELTPRESEVLRLLAQGLSNQQIADSFTIGVTTVKTHVGALYDKTGASSRVELAGLGAAAAEHFAETHESRR